MASKNIKSAVKVSKAEALKQDAARTARNTKRRNKRAEAKAAPTSATTTWAVGVGVEHPAHGKGIVSGHTETDDVILVAFQDGACLNEIEVVGAELKHAPDVKLEQRAVPHKPHMKLKQKGNAEQATDLAVRLHKPHTKKAFNFPKRKHAEKHAKNAAQELGTAQEQNAAYAKLARKFQMNDRVVELNGKKREGNVFTVAPAGSGYLVVQFGGQTTPETKFVGDLKRVEMKGRKVCIGDLVALKDTNELIGTVADAHFTMDQATVQDKNGVLTGARLSQLKVWKAPKPDTLWKKLGVRPELEVAHKNTPTLFYGTVIETTPSDLDNGLVTLQGLGGELFNVAAATLVAWKKPKSKPDTTKFENLPLLSGFIHKDAEHVKVGNTSAIITTIDRETNGGAGATIPMIRLAEIGLDKQLTKVRLKKDTQVKPIQSVPFGA